MTTDHRADSALIVLRFALWNALDEGATPAMLDAIVAAAIDVWNADEGATAIYRRTIGAGQ